jgi:hypothetical protein
MSKQLVKKTIAGTLIVTTIATSTIEAQACDSAAIMEATKQVSIMSGPLAPAVLIGGTAIAVGTGIVIGIKNKAKDYDRIYQTYGHLPDRWRPNSVIEKLNPKGTIIQRRFYGKDGKPTIDVDLNNHGTPEYHPFNYGGAHKHRYDWSNRRKPRQRGEELTQEEYKKYIKDFDSSTADKMRVEYKEAN